jgi:hypothetical protein
MEKRQFRGLSRPSPEKAADYPTLSEFEESRRSVLRRIGAAVLGLGSLGAILSACGDRVVHSEPDLGHTMGVARQPDSGIDQRPRLPDLQGVGPQPDALGDAEPPPDAEVPADAEPDWGMAGVPRMPDAEIDLPSDGGPGKD